MTILKHISKYIALLTLAGILLVASLYLAGRIEAAPMKTWFLVLTLLWFAFATIWMYEGKKSDQA
jgi:fatty acid desaturase